jgi:hypothetical protein
MSTETNTNEVPAAATADTVESAEGTNTRSATSRTRRERHARRNNNNNHSPNSETTLSETKFTGRCNELKGEIYNCSEFSQVDGYTKTTKEISEYVGRTYSADARTAVETLVLPTFEYPADPETGASATETHKWQKRVDSMVTREDRFEEDLKKVYSLIWGQCTEFLCAKLEAKARYMKMKSEYETVELSKSIKDCVSKFLDQKYAPLSLHEAMRKFYTSQQDKNSSAQDYYQKFKNQLEVVEHCGGSIGYHDLIVDDLLQEQELTRSDANAKRNWKR